MLSNIIKILFLGDVTGRVGRNVVAAALNTAKNDHKIDFVIANIENASNSTVGVDYRSLMFLSGFGIDIMTIGNHFMYCDNSIMRYKNVVRPQNVRLSVGRGNLIKDVKGYKIRVINVLGCIDMGCSVRNPIDTVRSVIKYDQDCINIVDYHASSGAEKLVACHCLKGSISALIGTHTHVPTNDCRIVDDVAFQTDAGLSGNMSLSAGKHNKIYSKIFYDSKNECPGSYHNCDHYAAMTGCVIEIDVDTKKPKNIYSILYSKYLTEANSNY